MRGAPWALLAGDEALLDGPLEAATWRWYLPREPAVVLGLAQQRRLNQLLDERRCRERGVGILPRRAGGGLVLLDPRMLCLTVAVPLPHPTVGDDLTASYQWLGDAFAHGLRRLGVQQAARVEIEPARAALRALRDQAGEHPGDAVARLLLETCYATPSPHEVLVGSRKLVGFAQVRRRDRALFQVGMLLRDQAPLADLARLADETERERYRAELRRRTVGLDALLPEAPSAEQLLECLAPALDAALDPP